MKKIGVKLADGTFYPLLEEGVPDKKKINLSTVKDNQTTVRVDLYASEKSSMADAILIKTLMLSDLKKQPSGEPDIYLSASIDKKNIIEAALFDERGKAKASESIDLREVLLASDKNPGSGKGLLAAAQEINDRTDADDFDFALPELSEGAAPKTELVVESEKKRAPAVQEESLSLDIPQEEKIQEPFEEPAQEPADTSLDLPDFDMPAFGDEQKSFDSVDSSSDDPLKFDDSDFDLPNFDDSASSSLDSSSSDSFDDPFADTSSSSSSSSSSSNLDFSDLYDDEEVEEKEKKTRLPVLICLICAIICIIAVLLLLFFIPSKSKSSKTEVVQEQAAAPLPPPVQKEEPLPPPPPPAPEPVAPAKEDEIVVVEQAESVVPDLPKVEEKKAPKVITYKIKWGDTLWDIADAYYKNPWRYPKIAKYNGIKNPNHIVAGTYIKIPEE